MMRKTDTRLSDLSLAILVNTSNARRRRVLLQGHNRKHRVEDVYFR